MSNFGFCITLSLILPISGLQPRPLGSGCPRAPLQRVEIVEIFPFHNHTPTVTLREPLGIVGGRPPQPRSRVRIGAYGRQPDERFGAVVDNMRHILPNQPFLLRRESRTYGIERCITKSENRAVCCRSG